MSEADREQDADEILVRRDGPRVDVVLNRPHRHNAFTHAMYAELTARLRALARDDEVRLVVVRGAGGRAFAAGNEIGDFVDMPDGAAAVEHEAKVQETLAALAALPQVSVAAVDGLCVGAGLAVATTCDLRVATRVSRFGYPIARTLGNALSAPVLARCVAVFGESIAREMLLASHLVDADRAHACGAVLDVLDDADALEARVGLLADGIALASPVTIGVTKRQLADPPPTPEEDRELLEFAYSSAGFAEGVRAFLAKERPVFPPTRPPLAVTAE